MDFKVKEIVKYHDILGDEYNSLEMAKKSNELIASRLVSYISDNLLVSHSNGKIDKDSTAKKILRNLDLTDKTIRDVNRMMLEDNPLVVG